MRNLVWAAGVAMMLAASATSANPLDDAKAGMTAFNKGDNATAVRLFTSAIDSRRLTRADQELAYVKRAQAHIALDQGQAALADSYSALKLDPADNEAIATRDRAQAMLTPPPGPTDAAPAEPPAYLKSQAAYQEALKRYEEQKNADAKHYDEQLAKYNELKAQQAREAQAAAAPSTASGSQTAKAPPPTAPATAKPTVEAKAQPTPKPATKPAAKKSAPKATPAPDDRPRFY